MIRSNVKLLFIVFLFVLTSFNVHAEWDNPGERYLNAYKQYEDAGCPIEKDNIKHFVYFSRDRGKIHEHPLLNSSQFAGAQIMYAWRQLETSKGEYDFSIILEDYSYLKSKNKKLFVQLQDATFDTKYNAVPKYIVSDEYDGGEIYQRSENGEPEGWVAKRWNKNVQARFADLLNELGRQFDGKIEGINLQESAIGVSNEFDKSFTPEVYVEALKTNMLALKKAFPKSTTMQYANFMPGEWLPWENKGYLKSIYQYGNEIGVGLGAPDLMVKQKGQLNHALAMMHESSFSVLLGIAVQDGNYIGQTGSDEVVKDRKNIVPLLHAFARDFLKVNYMFWVDQKPYFETDVLPCLTAK